MTRARPWYDAVLLAGFGGPERASDIMPFLRRVTAGRGVPEARLADVAHHYQALGGRSPINDQNRALQAALQSELDRRGADLPVLWGNRNWMPLFDETIAAAATSGLHRLIAVATSAYSSYSSCRQYREDFAGALHSTGLLGAVTVDKIRPFFDLAGFLDPFAEHTGAAVAELMSGGLEAEQIEIVFTTHSVPQSMSDSSGSAAFGDTGPGGAYLAQHLAACRAVAAAVATEFGELHWRLAFQSRSGPPSMPWLEPDVNDVIAGLPGLGRRAVIVVPIGFVSDHVEVIWDLDREARDSAVAAGLRFLRVPTPGTDPRFVGALADLVELACGRDRAEPARRVPGMTRPDRCPAACCRNARGPKPTTAAVDSAADWAGSGVDPERLRGSGICGDAPPASPVAGSAAQPAPGNLAPSGAAR